MRTVNVVPGHQGFVTSPIPVEDRFWARVDRSGGPDACWPWLAGTSGQGGYGGFYAGGTIGKIRAPRFAYQITYGQIPDGLQIDHLCMNPPCVNPAHLEVVTHRVNTLRGGSVSAVNARKTHCIRGHPFAGDNLRISRQGFRRCQECQRAKSRRRWAKSTPAEGA